jgi:hypothetical protein
MRFEIQSSFKHKKTILLSFADVILKNNLVKLG